MRMKISPIAICTLLVAASAAASAQAPGRVMTMTRTAKQFGDLEIRIDDAARKHDQAALEKLLAPRFEQRDAAAPGQPLPRADFIRRLLAQSGGDGFAIGDIAVHEFGKTAVVSYAATQFVVDVWVKNGDEYQLAVRYTGGPAAVAKGVNPKL
jgi:hypothetical protein